MFLFLISDDDLKINIKIIGIIKIIYLGAAIGVTNNEEIIIIK